MLVRAVLVRDAATVAVTDRESVLIYRITGGTRGIGAKIALALSKAGADLILVQRNTTNTQTKDAIEAAGGKADIVVADLADKASIEQLIPHVTKELGRTLDIVVNCGESASRAGRGGRH